MAAECTAFPKQRVKKARLIASGQSPRSLRVLDVVSFLLLSVLFGLLGFSKFGTEARFKKKKSCLRKISEEKSSRSVAKTIIKTKGGF